MSHPDLEELFNDVNIYDESHLPQMLIHLRQYAEYQDDTYSRLKIIADFILRSLIVAFGWNYGCMEKKFHNIRTEFTTTTL